MVNELADVQKKKAKCEAECFTNMDQFMSGNLDKDTYQKRRADHTKEAERLDGLISDQELEVIRDDGFAGDRGTVLRNCGAGPEERGRAEREDSGL